MRLSQSIQKNIIETNAGCIMNLFKLKKRRDALFFEDILANYIKMCEKKGYHNQMMSLGQKWMYCVLTQTLPVHFLKAIPPYLIINKIMRPTWINLGLMEDIKASKKGEYIEIKTVNETITRVIGENMYAVGSYMGTINVLFNSSAEYVSMSKEGETCTYLYKIKNEPYRCGFKGKKLYDHLNDFKITEGMTLKSALEKNIFQLRENNRIYYRNKSIIPGEQTIFHMIGNYNILLEEIPAISYDFFSEIIQKDSDSQKMLVHIKSILQIMGWGNITFTYEKPRITMIIKCPPYGFQLDRDNWEFLIRVILGYLWHIDRELKIKNIETTYKNLKIDYSN